MSGKRTLLRRGRLPSTRELFAPARMSSRTERPCAAACSFNLRYREVGISTVVRTASCFILYVSHICHKYGIEEFPIPIMWRTYVGFYVFSFSVFEGTTLFLTLVYGLLHWRM